MISHTSQTKELMACFMVLKVSRNGNFSALRIYSTVRLLIQGELLLFSAKWTSKRCLINNFVQDHRNNS